MGSISVAIPCYNYARYLPSCLESVLTQEGVELEVLILDDASTDATPDVGRRIAAQDPRVTFRRHERNQGHLATFNEGLDWASGDYTVLISADDLLVPGALRRAAAILDAHPTVGFVYGHPVYLRGDEPLPPARTGDGQAQIWQGAEWIARRCAAATNAISSPEVMVRTSVQQEVGHYSLDIHYAGDLAMWLRLAAHADVAYVRGADQAYYRIHDASMSATRTPFFTDLQERKQAFDSFFAGEGHRVPGAAALHERVNRALAREALWAACRAFDRRRLEVLDPDELASFAAAAYPGARSLKEYWSLQWRSRLGDPWCWWLQPLAFGAVIRKVRNRRWWRHWAEYGV